MRTKLGPAILAILFVFSAVCVAMATDWWPIQVKSYYGGYDPADKRPGMAAPGLAGPKLEQWRPPATAAKAYVIGVSFPHMKDSYWVAVNYGIISEAARLGIGVKLLEAGGYDNLETQKRQVRRLAKSDVDGIILGAISYQGNDALIGQVADSGIPVVEVVNDVSAPKVAAKALVSFRDMGFYAGEFVAMDAEDAGLDKVKVAFLPGPRDSGWAPDTLDGFKDAMDMFPGEVEVVAVKWGDTGAMVQEKLVSMVLDEHPDLDYLVGNAVAAQVAPALLKARGQKRPAVVATYIIPSLYDLIREGEVAAAPSDLTVFQGRMAVDMMVLILNGQKPGRDFPFRSGPFIPTITPDNIASYPFEGLFGPRGFDPVYELAPEK